jgi:hypothetical protein
MENVLSQHAGRSVSALVKGEKLRSSAHDSPASPKVSGLGFMRSAILGCLLFMVIATSGASAQYVAVDMTPAGLTGTLAANSAGVQGGQAFAPAFPNGHAFLLNGDPNSALDVHPASWYNSQVLAASGSQEVGFGLPVASTRCDSGRARTAVVRILDVVYGPHPSELGHYAGNLHQRIHPRRLRYSAQEQRQSHH